MTAYFKNIDGVRAYLLDAIAHETSFVETVTSVAMALEVPASAILDMVERDTLGTVEQVSKEVDLGPSLYRARAAQRPALQLSRKYLAQIIRSLETV